MHPLARPGNRSGMFNMSAGDRVRHMLDDTTGVADEFTHDGDALVTWDDGSFETVKARLLTKLSNERPVKTQRLAKWIGSDGKKYVTDDPEVVRMQIAHGHNISCEHPDRDVSYSETGDYDESKIAHCSACGHEWFISQREWRELTSFDEGGRRPFRANPTTSN